MKKLFVVMMAVGVLSACSMAPENKSDHKATQSEAKQAVNDDLYIAFYDGRMNIFYDGELYKKFLEHGETSYRRTFIGAGPNGETVVYGLTKQDKKKTTNPAEEMMSGKLKASEDFYGEVFKQEENRFYVFSDWEDFDKYVKTGADNLRFSDIASGPNGETVIYVLNEENKKKRPVKTMAKFKAFHGLK